MADAPLRGRGTSAVFPDQGPKPRLAVLRKQQRRSRVTRLSGRPARNHVLPIRHWNTGPSGFQRSFTTVTAGRRAVSTRLAAARPICRSIVKQFPRILGVSADGSSIVGKTGGKAFLWTDSDGLRLLVDVLEDAGLGDSIADWDLEEAVGISEDGLTINGTNPADEREAWIVTIPSPGVVPIMIGASSVCCRRRRARAGGIAGP